MENDYIKYLIECLKVIQNPDVEQSTKEKTIKELLKKSIDYNSDYGDRTKKALKDIVDISASEQELFVSIMFYLTSNDISC